ncbi:PrsW family intramembrane metalloprotease [Microbacterium sp. YY-01]|uniref:PrsW family intramembrane metalloprotease n=1 Tax=Microbacterium sp. YY-01 TaxID=3421634 RepID=UPI003D16612E
MTVGTPYHQPFHDPASQGGAVDPWGRGMQQPVQQPQQAIAPLPVPVRRGRSAPIWVFGVLIFLLLGIIGYFLTFLGAAASIVGLFAALIPLAIVICGALVIDRWEPEPWSLRLLALGWGGVVAVGMALIASLATSFVFGALPGYEAMMSIVQAPIVEEVGKGLGLLVIFLIARRTFDGPIDGVVYGALIGAGFAFVENIQYFAVSIIDGGAVQLGMTFVLRGLLSPFAHAMFTAVTGALMGIAARRHGTAGAVFVSGLLGLAGAIALHMFWNWSATFGSFFALYFTLQVPLFVGFIVTIVLLRREEERATLKNFAVYSAAGWFTPEEVAMLATPTGRRAGMQWAAHLRGDRRPLMRTFIRDATALASVRQRIVNGSDRLAPADEQALLIRMTATRAQLLAP